MLKQLRNLFKKNASLVSAMKEWQIPLPHSLWFAPQRDAVAELTPLPQIEKKLGMTWTEICLVPQRQKKSLVTPLQKIKEKIPSITRDVYLARLTEIQQKCVIRWLDDTVGWVLTLRAGETLAAGFLTCYSGLLTEFPREREYFFSLIKNKQRDIGVDGKALGNMGRLLPFLLEKEYLEYFILDESIKNKIAVANLSFELVKLDDMLMPGIFVTESITTPQNSELLLGLNYSLEYLWRMQKNENLFRLIDSNTLQQIDPALYQAKKITVYLSGMNYSFEMSRFRVLMAKRFPDLLFTTVGCDETTGEYFEIGVRQGDIYAAMMEAPEEAQVRVKPMVRKISLEEWRRRMG